MATTLNLYNEDVRTFIRTQGMASVSKLAALTEELASHTVKLSGELGQAQRTEAARRTSLMRAIGVPEALLE